LGHIARLLLGVSALALVLAGTGMPAFAQRLRTTPPPAATDDAGRDQGWQGLGPVEPPSPDTISPSRSDAEAAGLRTDPPAPAPGESRTVAAQRDRQRAEEVEHLLAEKFERWATLEDKAAAAKAGGR